METIKNTSTTYGRPAKFFHWAMAILFLGMFIIAYIMTNIPKSDFRYLLYALHKATGILLFGLVILRTSWRLFNIQPELARTIPLWQRRAAQWNIVTLYFLMFAMPMTGFLTSSLGGHDISFYNLFIIAPLGHDQVLSKFFSQTHEILSYLLITAFALHVIGAFYHHYFIKDEVLLRMLPRHRLKKKSCDRPSI